jgi:hypothetical protein
MFTASLPGERISTSLFAPRRGPHRKQSFPSFVGSIRVYRAVAWQRVVQIRDNVMAVDKYFQELFL